jgi:hypothetical protein
MGSALSVGLNAAILAVTGEEPRVLTLPREDGTDADTALPFGPLDPDRHRTLELGLRAWVRRQTGIELGYVEQLYTFGDRDRELEGRGGGRVISIAYLALVREQQAEQGPDASWRAVYRFFPWEDWRGGAPSVLSRRILPALREWVVAGERSTRDERRERVDITFGAGGAPWDSDRVLERYELLYEAGLVAEARRDRAAGSAPLPSPSGAPEEPGAGRPLALDHRRILATALARLRGKLKYRPLVFELVAPTFTLLQLQRCVEALAGVPLHKQNFRRLVEHAGLVEGTGRLEPHTGGRPAELFRFRHDVLRERPAPGVGLPRSAAAS